MAQKMLYAIKHCRCIDMDNYMLVRNAPTNSWKSKQTTKNCEQTAEEVDKHLKIVNKHCRCIDMDDYIHACQKCCYKIESINYLWFM